MRIGASSLLNDLLMQYAKTESGRYGRARGLLAANDAHERAHEHRLGLRARPGGDRPPPAARPLRPVHRRRVRDAARTARYVATVNPATEEPIAEVAWAAADRRLAGGRGARAAQPRWAALPDRERAKYLFRIARLIQERARELAVVETIDGGKPLRESRDVDIPLAAAHFFHYAGWADKLRHGVSAREVAPLGVVGQIVPWNFPLLMAAWKLAPALACGNTRSSSRPRRRR